MSLFRFFGTAGRSLNRQVQTPAPPPPRARSTSPPAPGLSEAERRELDWRRQEEERELEEGLRQVEIPERSLSAAEAWAESGEWFSGFTSTNVGSIAFDLDDRRLVIQYLDGSLYAYHPVSMPLAMSLYDASSKGIWVWDNLRVRGTVFGYQVPYEHLSGPSQRVTGQEARLWMRSEEARLKHGKIGPSGRDANGRKIRPRDLR